MNNYVILLSACINPNGMTFTELQDPKQREQQYWDAINFYMKHTKYKIVFCNNSGEDISFKFEGDKKRIEFLSFNGNNYDKELGKGYGEFLILKYAFKNSEFIKRTKNIIKITGRLIVDNISIAPKINDIILGFPRNKIYASFNFDLKFVDSRCLIACKHFFESFLTINSINDTQGYFFEHLLFDTIYEDEDRNKFMISGFCIDLNYTGISGTSGTYYDPEYRSLFNMLVEARNFCEYKKNTFKRSNKILFYWISVISILIRIYKAILKKQK